MKILFFPILLIFADGVFGFETDGVKSVSVKEGDSVTLHTCLNQIQKSNKILWMFENAVIANIKDQKLSTEDGPDGRFRDRLELDFESGSLTIRNIRTNHSGLYQVDMFGTSKSLKKFNVTVTGVFAPDADEIKAVSAMEGYPVTLNTVLKLQKDDLMLWRFARATKGNPVHHNPCQSDATAIAKIDGETREISLDPGDGEIFNNVVKVDKLSGSLTITNVRPEHSGTYILQISDNTGTKCRRFSITVNGGISDNVIEWRFESKVIARISRVANKTYKKTYDGADGAFKDRLELDSKTGSLTITNIRTTDSGDYQLQIANNGKVQSNKKFIVHVSDPSKSDSETPLTSAAYPV
ncbi:uncharacterized protein LOC130071890 [Rhinichthys klamathensis goyatoka]|uniref:uncharacterized protein LOC130071890 n=1 Tax=Rhinichthys klamathensis goyatoka TaxID=3034132 RepID=UPI0024B5BEBF|nr:uncharacterized protein LOC130071890 [Rhinichthys klamathensis goyatoka]